MSVYINTTHFKGHLLNNKPNGEWKEISDSGQYLLGEKVGYWVIHDKLIFFPLKHLDTTIIEVFNDTIVQHFNYKKRMELKGELLRTWEFHPRSKKVILKKYAAGKKYQKAIFNQHLQLQKIKSFGSKNNFWGKKETDFNEKISIVNYFYYEDKNYQKH